MFIPFLALTLSFSAGAGHYESAVLNKKLNRSIPFSTVSEQDLSFGQRQEISVFTGRYTSIHMGKELAIMLNADKNQVTGLLTKNGERAKIVASIKNYICSGKIVEESSEKSYDFTAVQKGDRLNLSFVIPGHNTRTVMLSLKKESDKVIAFQPMPVKMLSSVARAKTNEKKRNLKMIGIWRCIEANSNKNGRLPSSGSTSYFVKLNSDGSGATWISENKGETGNNTIDRNVAKKQTPLEWYTEGSQLFLKAPLTKEQSSLSFYAETNRMILSGNTGKRIYQRIN